MKTPLRCLLLVTVGSLCTLAFDGPFFPTKHAAAQGFGRGREGGGGGGGGSSGESREERRERWRQSMGGGNRGGEGGPGGRDGRGGGDGERRGDNRSNGPSPSGGGSSGSTSGPPAAKPSSSPSSSATPSLSQTDYAKGLVKMYDKNGDHMLQAEERKGLTGRAAESDLDKDGVITIDELVAHLSAPASTTPSTTPTPSPSSDGGSGGGGGGDSGRRDRDGDRRKGDSDGARRVYTGSAGGPTANSKEGDKRRTYRFSTSADRLPKSLPSYFSRDTNGDGQVSMSEYSRTWSKSTVAEFRKYDLNDDGIITAKEATHSSGSGG